MLLENDKFLAEEDGIILVRLYENSLTPVDVYSFYEDYSIGPGQIARFTGRYSSRGFKTQKGELIEGYDFVTLDMDNNFRIELNSEGKKFFEKFENEIRAQASEVTEKWRKEDEKK